MTNPDTIEQARRVASLMASHVTPATAGSTSQAIVDRLQNDVGPTVARALAHEAITGVTAQVQSPEQYSYTPRYGVHNYPTVDEFVAQTGRQPGPGDAVRRDGHDSGNKLREGEMSRAHAQLLEREVGWRQPFRRESEKIGAAYRAAEQARRERETAAAALPGRWW
jgi:hypothetical protein